jgi:hypothetical protein
VRNRSLPLAPMCPNAVNPIMQRSVDGLTRNKLARALFLQQFELDCNDIYNRNDVGHQHLMLGIYYITLIKSLFGKGLLRPLTPLHMMGFKAIEHTCTIKIHCHCGGGHHCFHCRCYHEAPDSKHGKHVQNKTENTRYYHFNKINQLQFPIYAKTELKVKESVQQICPLHSLERHNTHNMTSSCCVLCLCRHRPF